MITWLAVADAISKAGPLGAKFYDWWAARQRQFLAPTLDPFEDPQMLRAFSVTLKNVSDTRLRLDEIYIRIPEGSEFAINWHVPLIILGGISSPSPPWERSRKYPLNHTLDPGESYECEIGIPPGFAISASRKPPVTIAVSFTTRGSKERRLVQDIKRHIAI